jgi:hypothetical protein
MYSLSASLPGLSRSFGSRRFAGLDILHGAAFGMLQLASTTSIGMIIETD